jgi:hypothetical protein
MPNFSQTYADACGVRLPDDAPEMPSSYYPIPERYITMQASGGHPARDYPLFSEVCNLLIQKLNKLDIKIIQLGSLTDTPIKFCIDLRGKTTFRQSAFVIENSLLHMGVDSSLSHLSGINDIPLVVLVPNHQPSVVLPHYCNEKTTAIQSDRKGKKPSYHPYDKTISTIKPEVVANEVLNYLGINEKVVIKTLFIGDHFSKDRVVDFIPNFPIQPNLPYLSGAKLNCRADLEFNLNAINQLISLYKSSLVTNKKIPENILVKNSENIEKLVIKLENGYDKSYIKSINKIGIQYILSFCGEEKALNDIRLDLFDFNPVYKQVKVQKPLDIEGLSSDTIVRTSRTILSDNNLYATKFHWKNNIPFKGEPFKIGAAIDSLDFWDSLEHFYIYNI